MRRSDREVTDIREILTFLDECRVMRLAMQDKNGVLYLVPLHYGYAYESKTLTLYFHAATEGRKLDILRERPAVAFEMDREDGIAGNGAVPCSYTGFYMSVTGTGTAAVLSDPRAKQEGLRILMQALTKQEFTFDEAMAQSVAVVKITVDRFTCKKHSKEETQWAER